MELKKSFAALRRRLKSGKKNESHPMPALDATNQEIKIPHLPIDIISEILSRLPVKSVMNCRKVCKQWRAITTTSHFSEMHLKRSPSNRPTILTFDNRSNTITVIDYVSWEVILKLRKKTDELLVFQGSCNGVLCLYNVKLASIELLNPMTCESIMIPEPFPELCEDRYSLGFDPATNKFKVLCTHGYIYTVGGSEWRPVKNYPLYRFFKEAVYANGALHWLEIRDDQKTTFYTLNLKDETIATTNIWETLGRRYAGSLPQLCELEGRIWISQYSENSTRTKRRIDMFTMDTDQDNKNQWILKYTIKGVLGPFSIVHPSPLIIIPTEKIILCNRYMNWLIRYDMRRRWWRRNFKVSFDLVRGSVYAGLNCKERKYYCENPICFISCIPFRESVMEPANHAAFEPPMLPVRPVASLTMPWFLQEDFFLLVQD